MRRDDGFTMEAETVAKQLEAYRGWKLVGVAPHALEPTDPYEYEAFPVLILTDGEREIGIKLMRDEEGNGPGAVSVLEVLS